LNIQEGLEAVNSIAGHGGSEGVQNVALASVSRFLKTFEIHRALDTEKNVLVYTVVSTLLINGSPFNSISVVPVEAR
jgi:catabolite regulation protein CreA